MVEIGKSKGKLFFILGPNSSFKSQTARDVAAWIEFNTLHDENPQSACMFSRGSVFRAVAQDLKEMGYSPETVSSDAIDVIIKGFQIRRKVGSYEIGIYDRHGNGKEHSLHNGNAATEFSQNPLFQDKVIDCTNRIVSELRNEYDHVIVEGRDMFFPDNPLENKASETNPADKAVWLTAPYKSIRTSIKKLEYPEETKGKTDLEIAEGIRKRDCKDFRKKDRALRIPRNIPLIRRESFNPENPRNEDHLKIVSFIGKRILDR